MRHTGGGERDSLAGRRRVMLGLMGGGLAGLVLPLAACGVTPVAKVATGAEGQAGGQASLAADKTAGVTVEMTDQNKFVPATLTIPAGTTVVFKNVGSMAHNVVTDPAKAVDKSHARVPSGVAVVDSGMITGGRSWSYTFATAGEYRYFCQPHEMLGMVGTVTVTG